MVIVADRYTIEKPEAVTNLACDATELGRRSSTVGSPKSKTGVTELEGTLSVSRF